MKEKPSIAFVHDAIGDITGGSLHSTIRFAEILKKRGHKVIFIGSRCSNSKPVDYLNGIKRYRMRALPIYKLVKTETRNFWSAIPFTNELKKIFQEEKIDVVHIVFPLFFMASAALIAAKKLNIPVVMHSHVQPENLLLNLNKKLNTPRLAKLLYRNLFNFYKKGEITLCPSRFSELSITKYGKLKTRIVSNGVELKKFKKINIGFLYKKYNLNKKDKRILFVGRLDPEKNVKTLVKSAKYLIKKDPSIHIDIVGGESDREEIMKMIQNPQYQNKITCYGRVDEKDLIGFYNACDIYVQPSIFELEGMVVLEAMACGKPIIISNSQETAAKYLVEGNGLLFNTKNPKDLAEKILKILGNKKIKTKMGKKSLELSKKYDIDQSVDILEDTYLEVLKEKPKKLNKNDERWFSITLPIKIYKFLIYASKNALIDLGKIQIYGLKISDIKIPKIKIPSVKIPNTGLSKTVFKRW